MNEITGSKGAAPVLRFGDPLAGRRDDRVVVPTVKATPVRPPSDVITPLSGEVMGVAWSARAIAPPGTDPVALTRAVQEELDAVALIFHRWNPASEVARFNAVEPGAWSLSDELWTVLNAVMDMGDDTNGAIDPTLGALVDLWGFGPQGPRVGQPTEDEIEAALGVSGWQDFRLVRDHKAAVQFGGTRLDFTAVIKGHAADRVSDRLSREGATSHLIDVGGVIKGIGVKPDAQPWWIELRQPPGLTAPRTVVALVDLALSTSSDYDRAVDGRSGRPVDNGLVSVSVLHPSAMQADALATALMVMGPVDGPDFAAATDLAAHFVERSTRGLSEGVSPALAAMLEDAEDAPS